MIRIAIPRRLAIASLALLVMLLAGTLLVHTVNAGSSSKQIRSVAFSPKTLRQRI